MTRGLCSGSGWILFLATLRAVLAHADNVTVNNLWTTADTITISILPLDLSNQRILVSVQQENDTKIIVDTLPGQATDTQNVLAPIRHKVEELQPDTMYELCVVLSEQENSQSDAQQSKCYKVKTFPKVDNVKGIYAALASTAVFLVACGFTWLLYKAFWVKYFTRVLKIQDSQQVEQQVEGQSASSPSQDIIISETESTISSITTTT